MFRAWRAFLTILKVSKILHPRSRVACVIACDFGGSLCGIAEGKKVSSGLEPWASVRSIGVKVGPSCGKTISAPSGNPR